MLETEADYGKYGIDRKKRHRYWSPPTSLPRITPPIGRVPRPDKEQYDEQAIRLEDARRIKDAARRLETHLANGDGAKAFAALQLLKHLDPERDYAKHDARVRVALRHETFLESNSNYAPLFDRGLKRDSPIPLSSTVVRTQFVSSPQFREWHPHGEQLAQYITLGKGMQDVPLADFAKWLQTTCKTPVFLNEQALLDDGLGTDEPINLPPLRNVTLRTTLGMVLEPLGLTFIDGKDVIQITTQLHAEEVEVMETRVYPVVDLVRTDVLPEAGWMAHPFLDRKEAAAQRVAAKLKQKIDGKFADVALSDAMAHIGRQLGETIVVDELDLLDDGLGTDEPISLGLKNVPAREVLRWALEPIGLTTVMRGDVLHVTTQLAVEEHLETRVYTAVGLVHELPPQAREARRRMGTSGWFGGGFGGFSGGGFGGGGGLGGGGGGFGVGGGFGGGIGGMGGGGFGGLGGMPPNGLGGLSEMPASPGLFGGTGIGPWTGGVAQVPNRFEAPTNSIPNADELDDEPVWDDLGIRDTIMRSSTGVWEEIHGTGGTLTFLPATMTWVSRQTAETHNEMDALLARLRSLRVDASLKPRDLPNITAKHVAGWDVSALRDMVMNETSQQWEEIDGTGGTISAHVPTMSLVIRSTPNGHEEIYELLAKLRRVASTNRRRQHSMFLPSGRLKPWASVRANFTDWPLNSRDKDAPGEDAPVGTDAELKLLAVRRVEKSGHWQVDMTDGNSGSDVVGFRHDAGRSRLTLPDRVVRLDGDMAAVSYPSLRVVEVGTWSNAARGRLDAELPWLPHRSNAELARLFEVTRLGEDADTVHLQFTVPDEDTGKILGSFAKQDGRLVEWTVWLVDRLVLRLQFDKDAVVATDSDGNKSETWRPVDKDTKPVPELLASWDGQLVLITESAERAGVQYGASKSGGAYREAVDALSRDERKSAARTLRKALASSENQPMLQFLLASCFSREDKDAPVTAEEATNALRVVAKSGTSRLLDEFNSPRFAFLTPASRLELLLLQPEAERTSADWSRLAEAAFEVGEFKQALEHIKQARQAPGARPDFELDFVELGALLGLDRKDAGKKLAERMFRSKLSLSQTAALANRMANGGFRALADSLLQDAITGNLSEANRERLVHHRAALHSGLARWRIVLSEAARLSRLSASELEPEMGSNQTPSERSQMWVTAVLNELTTADAAARLAEEFKTNSFATDLLIREAELAEPAVGADRAWSLFSDNRLPGSRVEWLVELLTKAQQHKRVVTIVENELRRSPNVSGRLLDWLTTAYQGLNRPADALRASSHQTEVMSIAQNRQQNVGSGGGLF